MCKTFINFNYFHSEAALNVLVFFRADIYNHHTCFTLEFNLIFIFADILVFFCGTKQISYINVDNQQHSSERK